MNATFNFQPLWVQSSAPWDPFFGQSEESRGRNVDTSAHGSAAGLRL